MGSLSASLARHLNGRMAVLDNTFLQPSNNSDVHLTLQKAKGLDSLTAEEIQERIERIIEVEQILQNYEFVVPPKVERIIEKIESQINNHGSYLTKTKARGYQTAKRIFRRRKSLATPVVKRGRELRIPWEEDRSEAVSGITAYADRFYKLIKKLHKSIRQNKDYDEHGRYNAILTMLHEEIPPSFLMPSSKDPQYLFGPYKKNMDILATAFTYVFQTPIVILTKNKIIEEESRIISELFQFDNERKRYGFDHAPEYDVKIYGLEERENHTSSIHATRITAREDQLTNFLARLN